MFWLFGHESYGILASQQGVKSVPPALEGKALTTGPPGKSLKLHLCIPFSSPLGKTLPICYGLNAHVHHQHCPPKSYAEILTPRGDGIRMWGLKEVLTSLMEDL